MASFPLYDTFFYYFAQKSSLFVQLFRKKWEKNWASTKKLFDTPLKGAGGLHQDFLEIDFLVVFDREELQLSDTFYQIKKYCSWPEISLVKGQRCSVIVLRTRFSIAFSENRTGKSIYSYSF